MLLIAFGVLLELFFNTLESQCNEPLNLYTGVAPFLSLPLGSQR